MLMGKPINELRRDSFRELARLIFKNSNGDGMHPVAIDALQCIRMSTPNHELPHVYNPCLCVIVQGEKQVLLESETYRYAPQQFLAVSVSLPLFGQVLVASADAPYLCLAIDLDASTIADLLAQMDDADWPRGETARGLFVGDLDAATLESVVRLARLLDAPRDIQASRITVDGKVLRFSIKVTDVRKAAPEELVDRVQVDRKGIDLTLARGLHPVLVGQEGLVAVDVVPDLGIVGVEDMRAIFMHLDAFDITCKNITSDMIASVNN